MDPGILSLAVRDLLRDHFSGDNFPLAPFAPEDIEVLPGPNPPPYVGNRFIAVYGSQWDPASPDVNVAIDGYLGVSCTLTVRSPTFPLSVQGVQLYAKEVTGMSRICYEITKAVTMKPDLYTRLAEYSSYDSSVFEYLRWQGTDPAPIRVNADHFGAYNEHVENDLNGTQTMGYTMTVRFGNARMGHLQ